VVLVGSFILLVLASLISFHYHISLRNFLIGAFIVLFVLLILSLISFWLYLIIKNRSR
jgi:hypothetical protein